jgi:hypothetical protein
MGGGGDTTNVTNTGLGDDQYQTLADNQAGISDQITTAADDAETRYKGFDGRFDSIDTGLSGLGTNLTSGFTNIQDLMDTYNTASTKRFDDVNTGLALNNQNIGANATSLTNLSGNVSSGFEDMSGRFDTVDQANTNLQTSVDQGFEDQSQGFSDLEAGMNNQFDGLGSNMDAGFANTQEDIANSLNETNTNLDNVQSNVLGGQNTLGQNLDSLSGNVDAYATEQLANQATLQSTQDEFRTNFDNYVERYSDDTTLANQTRADIQAAQAAGFDATRDSIGTLANTTAEGQQALAQQADANNRLMEDTVQGGFQQTQQTSQNLRDVLSNQIDDTTSGIMSNQESMANTQGQLAEGQQNLANTFMTESGEIDTALVNQTKNLAGIAATQTDLDMGMRQNFQQLSGAFDDQGQLIQNSVDENGNTIMREMDQNGNLMLRALDATGRDMGSKIINVGQSMQDLQGLQRKQGSNMAMGNLSPASQGSVPTSGFATPFTTTQ